MYGIIGENPSDTESLKILIRKLRNEYSLSIRTVGYSGCGELLTKGGRQLRLFAELGCTRFVVCHDADGPTPDEKYSEVMKRVVKPSGLSACCIVIPVYEIEAWILADVQAVSNVIRSWRPSEFHGNPEAIPSPKERLIRDSRMQGGKPRYTPSAHNEKIAIHLRVDELRRRCPSFEHFARFVTGTTMTPGQRA